MKLLRDRPDRPVTVGVHGDWGAGKSSVLEMIEAGFDGEGKALCLKFNSWRFQGFEDEKIALIEGIVTGLIEKRPLLTKAGEAAKDVFRRIDWLKVAKKAGGLAFTAHRASRSRLSRLFSRGRSSTSLRSPGYFCRARRTHQTRDALRSSSGR